MVTWITDWRIPSSLSLYATSASEENEIAACGTMPNKCVQLASQSHDILLKCLRRVAEINKMMDTRRRCSSCCSLKNDNISLSSIGTLLPCVCMHTKWTWGDKWHYSKRNLSSTNRHTYIHRWSSRSIMLTVQSRNLSQFFSSLSILLNGKYMT